MFKSICTILVLFCLQFIWLDQYAMEQDLDSIQAQLLTHQDEDTTRVLLLLTAAGDLANVSPQKAFLYIDEAMGIVDQIGWKKGVALVYRQRGDTYYRMGNNTKAMDAYQASLKSGGFSNDKLQNAKLYNNLANIYADLKEFDKSLTNYQSYLEIANELNDVPNQINALGNLGTVYTEIDQIDEGIAYHVQALALANEQEMNFAITAITNNLGLAFKRKGDYIKSLDYYQEARQLSIDHGYKHIEASALNSIGKVNILLGNYDLAKLHADQALVLALEVEALEWQADAWQILNTVYEHQGDSENALMAYKSYIQLRDSIISEEKKVELTRKDMQYQLEKQESLATSEIRRQRVIRNAIIAVGALVLLFSLIAYLFHQKRRNALEQKKESDFERQVAETELKALRSQINPHFIFNSLNSISDYISKNDIENANTYLVKFSKLMRSILENSEQKWILLEEEISLIRLYLQIESQRLPHKLTYNISVDEDLDLSNTLVPPLISQPFLENSIWHGIAPKEGKGHIDVVFRKGRDTVICEVDDNGVGRNAQTNGVKSQTSLGVKITKARLEILNQLKEVKANLKMIDKDQGLKVVLTLPLELRF